MTNNEVQEQRWVKVCGPGQIRGEGEWITLDNFLHDWTHKDKEEYWVYLCMSGYLPIARGDKPND